MRAESEGTEQLLSSSSSQNSGHCDRDWEREGRLTDLYEVRDAVGTLPPRPVHLVAGHRELAGLLEQPL